MEPFLAQREGEDWRSAHGRPLERLLETAGYAMTRVAGSLGAWDLIGVSATYVALVQVKSNRLPSLAERKVLELFPCPSNCKRLVHDRQRWPEVREL